LLFLCFFLPPPHAMVKKLVKAAARKARRQRAVQKKKQERLKAREPGTRISSTEQADAILNSLCVGKLAVTPEDEWEDVSTVAETTKMEDGLQCSVMKELRGKRKPRVLSRGVRRRKDRRIVAGIASQERLVAKVVESRRKRKTMPNEGISLPHAGRPMSLSDLQTAHPAASVCIIGTVAMYNPGESEATLTPHDRRGKGCTVDLSAFPPFCVSPYQLVQVIGEVRYLAHGPHVIARAVRPMDGLDIPQYITAMTLLAQFPLTAPR